MCLHIKWLTVSLLSFERHWLTTTWWFRDFQSQTEWCNLWWWALYNKNHLAYHMQLSLDDRRHLIAVKQWLKPKETWDIILVDKLGYWTAWNDHQANLTDYKLAVKWDFYENKTMPKFVLAYHLWWLAVIQCRKPFRLAVCLMLQSAVLFSQINFTLFRKVSFYNYLMRLRPLHCF